MSLEQVLKQYQSIYSPVVPYHLQHGEAIILDLSGGDAHWLEIDMQSIQAMDAYTHQLMQEKNAVIAIGRYNEDRRFLYQRSPLFTSSNLRSIHLGVDLTLPENTPVFSPLDAEVYSIQNNQAFGDYGPTIILKHQLEHHIFYTLYGHLSEESLLFIKPGQRVPNGQQIGWVGSVQINGGWPTHLHFQIISDMQGVKGDFPGVTDKQHKKMYLNLCPNPNYILQIQALASDKKIYERN